MKFSLAKRFNLLEKGSNLLKQVVETDPADADAWNELGFAHRNMKQYKASAAAYNRALELDPDHLGALNYQGFMFLETGQADKARANAARLKDLCGNCEEYNTLSAGL